MGVVLNISVIQALLIGLTAAVGLMSWIATYGYALRALVMAAITGLILGHAKVAIEFGAAAELLFLGLINAAGVVPPNPLGPGIFGAIFAVEGTNIGTALSLSLPFAVFIQFLVTLILTIMSPIGQINVNLLKKNRFALFRLASFGTFILLGLAGFIIGTSAGLGAEAFHRVINKIPVWLQTGLGVAGSMLPAMGFAVVLRLMLKREYAAFLLVGFSLVIIFQGVAAAKPEWGFNLVALALTAAGIALLVYFSGTLTKTKKVTSFQVDRTKPKEGEDGI